MGESDWMGSKSTSEMLGWQVGSSLKWEIKGVGQDSYARDLVERKF